MIDSIKRFMKIEYQNKFDTTLLSELNINPEDYKHEMFNHVFVSFEEKLNGLKFHSSDELTDGKEFYKVDLKDFEDGTIEVEFYYHNCGIEKCADVINKYYSIFGKDANDDEEFNSMDFKLYPQLIKIPLRRWKFDNYEIQIGKGSRQFDSCFIKCLKTKQINLLKINKMKKQNIARR